MARAAKTAPAVETPATTTTTTKPTKLTKTATTMNDEPTPKSTQKVAKTVEVTPPQPTAATKPVTNPATADTKPKAKPTSTPQQTTPTTQTTQTATKTANNFNNNRIAQALAAARNLRPEKAEKFDTMKEAMLPKDFVPKSTKRKTPYPLDKNDELFSEAAIAQAVKKQRLLTDHTIAKNNVKSNNKEKKSKSAKKNLNSFRQLSDSDNDSDNDDADDDFAMDDCAGKDHYEADEDFDEMGNPLVSLTSALLSLHNVRTAADTELDKKLGKQADDMYNRKKKVVASVGKDGKAVKKDLSGNKVESESLERIDRTVFLGNVPTACKDSDIKTFLGVPVESIRYRSAGFDTPHLAKWVAFATKRFHDKRDTLVAFVVLKNSDDIQAVLQKNQQVMLDKHIRVDLAASDGKVDHQRSVFVGNLPYDVTEETLFEIFESCGDIEAIRCVRDNNTGIGKGFAFVTFASKSCVPVAMKMDGKNSEATGRKLRLTKVSPNAFGKTATFKAEQEKAKVLLAKQRALSKSRSERLKQSVLGTKTPMDKKKFKVQGSYQKIVGNAGVGNEKKSRHAPRQSTTDAPTWQGNRAKPSDTLGRNKASKKTGKGSAPTGGKGAKGEKGRK